MFLNCFSMITCVCFIMVCRFISCTRLEHPLDPWKSYWGSDLMVEEQSHVSPLYHVQNIPCEMNECTVVHPFSFPKNWKGRGSISKSSSGLPIMHDKKSSDSIVCLSLLNKVLAGKDGAVSKHPVKGKPGTNCILCTNTGIISLFKRKFSPFIRTSLDQRKLAWRSRAPQSFSWFLLQVTLNSFVSCGVQSACTLKFWTLGWVKLCVCAKGKVQALSPATFSAQFLWLKAAFLGKPAAGPHFMHLGRMCC